MLDIDEELAQDEAFKDKLEKLVAQQNDDQKADDTLSEMDIQNKLEPLEKENETLKTKLETCMREKEALTVKLEQLEEENEKLKQRSDELEEERKPIKTYDAKILESLIYPINTIDQIAAAYRNTGENELVAEQLEKVAELTIKQIESVGIEEIPDILETHIHADHLSAGDYLRQRTQAPIVVGNKVGQIQKTFSKVFNESSDFAVDGRQFDKLVGEGDVLLLGKTSIRVLNTPGHTPACVSYIVNDRIVFIGDTLFMNDTGSARCDFPAGDAGTLYDSVQKLYALGDHVIMYLCHDYPPHGRDVQATISVAKQRQHNIHIHQGISRDEFIAVRNERDASLNKPRLILPSLQVNIRAGALPEAESNGVSYLKVPINLI